MADVRVDSRPVSPLGIRPGQAGMTIEEALNLAFAVRQAPRSRTPVIVALSLLVAAIAIVIALLFLL
ncbi:MAG: hypothetical protein NVS3B21_34170 [Acidimicrobiales bacterium]